MNEIERPRSTRTRVAKHRTRIAADGSRRIEVTVPSGDAGLVKALARTLRAGGRTADLVRDSLQPILAAPKAQTGAELVAFFRASPLANADLQFERDTSTGRSVELEP